MSPWPWIAVGVVGGGAVASALLSPSRSSGILAGVVAVAALGLAAVRWRRRGVRWWVLKAVLLADLVMVVAIVAAALGYALGLGVAMGGLIVIYAGIAALLVLVPLTAVVGLLTALVARSRRQPQPMSPTPPD